MATRERPHLQPALPVLAFVVPVTLSVVAVVQILILLPRSLRRFEASGLDLPDLTAGLSRAHTWLAWNPLGCAVLLAALLTPSVVLPSLAIFTRPPARDRWRVALFVFQVLLLALNLLLFQGMSLPVVRLPDGQAG